MHPSNILLFSFAFSVNAHFPLVDNAHGGATFDKWSDAAFITDITRSSSTSRVALCGHLYFWLKFDRPSDFDTLMVGGTVPVVERFKDDKVAVAVFGRGLPAANATQDEIDVYCDRSPIDRKCKGYDDIPDDLKVAYGEIQNDMGVDDLGVIAVPGVEDLSNCDFGEDPLTIEVTGSLYIKSSGGEDVNYATYHDWGGETRCFFHEEFGGSDMWVVQDKLIDLAGNGDHYIVFWSPGDSSLGASLTPTKFGAVFGDEGQSEDFSGDVIQAGECSLPAQDFNEQDCHGYTKPFIPGLIEDLVEFFFGEQYRFFTNFIYLPWGGAPCRDSYAVTIPNKYICGDDEPDIACTGLCHNHGTCPANESIGEFNISECATIVNEDGFPECGETCAQNICGADQNDTIYGPIGPACKIVCEDQCSFIFFDCKTVCDFPSSECVGVYEEEHS